MDNKNQDGWVEVKFYPDIQEFKPIPLPNKDGQTTTRKVIKAKFVNPNPRNPQAPLKVSVCHQKKSARGKFEDCEHFPLSHLKSGQEIQMILDTEQTLALQAVLKGLYEYCRNNLGLSEPVPIFTLEKADEIVKVAPNRKTIIQKLIDGKHGQEFWEELEKLDPNEATKLSYSRIFTIREKALNDFKTHLKYKDWSENEWQEFFEKNTWIFGYGLTFKWIKPIGSKFQQTTKGSSIEGAGKRPDGFAQTVASIATTVFVDIKKPETPLLESKEYRPDVFPPSSGVVGGISQIQKTIDKWLEQNRSRVFQPTNKDGYTDRKSIFSYQPKGILVIGKLAQFKKESKYHKERLSSFELFRRQTTNPEIITFDELYHRAKHIVSTTQTEV